MVYTDWNLMLDLILFGLQIMILFICGAIGFGIMIYVMSCVFDIITVKSREFKDKLVKNSNKRNNTNYEV